MRILQLKYLVSNTNDKVNVLQNTTNLLRFPTAVNGKTLSQSLAPTCVNSLTSIFTNAAKDVLNWTELLLSPWSTSCAPPLTTQPTWAPSMYALHATRISWARLQKFPATKSLKFWNQKKNKKPKWSIFLPQKNRSYK